jgi:hypothetical protein
MTCEEIKKLLTKYVQHTADEEEIKKVEEHLCVCHDCRSSLGKIMDKLDESDKEDKPKDGEKEEEKDDDFEIISSDEPFPPNLEEGKTSEAKEEKIKEPKEPQKPQETKEAKEAQETQKAQEPKEPKEPKESKEPKEAETPEPDRAEESTLKKKKEEAGEQQEEDRQPLSSGGQEAQQQSPLESARSGKDEDEEDAKEEGMEYFPADGIKTFSQEESDGQGAGQADLAGEEKEASSKQEKPKMPETKPADVQGLETAKVENQPKLDLISYITVGLGALVLIILIFLLFQG